ncbi:DUF2461 family protein [Thermodesulfobacteriota bacterium]
MAEFNGFPRQYFTFFNQLQKNNSKEWFEKHREDHDAFYSEALIDYAYTHYKNMLPLHQWLKKVLDP